MCYLIFLLKFCNSLLFRKKYSKASAIQVLERKEVLERKFERKAELREKELELKKMELDLQRRKLEQEQEERKQRLELELEERRSMLDLLKKHL